MKVLLCAINSQYIHSNPALYSLARAVEAMPAPPQLLTRQYSLNLPYESILHGLYEERPDILAFSVYIWNVSLVRLLLSDLGKLLPQTLLLAGGPEASACAEQLLTTCPELHGVLLGEGELLWLQLLARLQQGEQRPALPGLCWRGGRAPEVAAAPLPDLAVLPFLYNEHDLAALRAAGQVVYYESSRGCPYACSFCASAEAPLRERPLALVLQELPLLAQAGGQIKFVDRTFNAAPARAAAITQAVLQLYRPGLSWHFEISPYALPAQLLQLWGQAPPGYIRLEAGVQSLYPPALAAIRRGGDWAQAQKALSSIIAQDNVHVHVDLIAGLPEETPHTFAAAFAELHALAPHYLQLGFLKILPASPLATEAAGRGLLYSAYPPYQVLQTPTMSAAYLMELSRAAKALNTFYNSGRFRQSLLMAAELMPGGPLEVYMLLARAMEKRGPGGLTLAAQVELLAGLLCPLDERLFIDLLRLDWLSYQDNQPLPPFLRRPEDGKNSFVFHYTWLFNEAGRAEQKPGPSVMSFDWRQRPGVSGRALAQLCERL